MWREKLFVGEILIGMFSLTSTPEIKTFSFRSECQQQSTHQRSPKIPSFCHCQCEELWSLKYKIKNNNILMQRIRQLGVDLCCAQARSPISRTVLTKRCVQLKKSLMMMSNTTSQPPIIDDEVLLTLGVNNRTVQNEKMDFKPVVASESLHHSLIIRPPDQPVNPKTLRVSVLGMPNAGKSTFINSILGKKVMATSGKIDTTIENCLAIATIGDTQILFQDTPGMLSLSKANRHRIAADRVSRPSNSFFEADLGIILADLTSRRVKDGYLQPEILMTMLKNRHVPTILVLNKVDKYGKKAHLLVLIHQLTAGRVAGVPYEPEKIKLVPMRLPKVTETILDHYDELDLTDEEDVERRLEGNGTSLLNKLRHYRGWPHFQDVFTISAKERKGLSALTNYMLLHAKPGSWQYHSEVVTDASPKQYYVFSYYVLLSSIMLSCKIQSSIPRIGSALYRKFATTSAESLTIVKEEGGVRRITLNNPRKRNVLSISMLQTLKDDISNKIDSESLRIIVLAANGPVFCAGHDLRELLSLKESSKQAEVFGLCSEVMQLIQSVPVPVICQVDGLATAAGCQLVATCDIAIASEDATFCTPGVNVGLFCSTPAVALGRAVPRKLAMEMLFTGEVISAQRALLHGLVSRVVPQETLEDETNEMVTTICQNSRSVMALGKAAFYRQITKDLSSAYRDTSCVMVDNLGLKDGKEGLRSFVEKRKPKWGHTFD